MNPAQPLSNATGGECASDSLKVPPRNSMAAVTPARLHSKSFLQHCVPTGWSVWQRMTASGLTQQLSNAADVYRTPKA